MIVRFREFPTYDDLHKFAVRARSKSKGRPVSSGWRVIAQDLDEEFPVYGILDSYHGKKGTHFLVYPDNRLEIHSDGGMLGPSPSYVLDKLFGIWTHRLSTRRYAVFGPHQRFKWITVGTPPDHDVERRFFEDEVECSDKTGKAHALTFYFDGTMVFELHKDKVVCLNPKGDPIGSVDTDARKQWLKDRRWFKNQFMVLARVGALDNPLRTVVADEHKDGRYLYWAPWSVEFKQYRNAANLNKAIVECMQKRVVDANIMVAAAAHALISTHSDGETRGEYGKLSKAMSKYLNNNSVELRSMFGVFNEEVSDDS